MKKYWSCIIATLIGITFISCSCCPTSFNFYEKTVEHHVIIDIERDHHQNSVYPIDPVYSITLEDSSKLRTSYQYHIGDTVTYIIYELKK